MTENNHDRLKKQISGYAGLKRALPELFIAGLLINILGLAMPLALMQMYDRIIPNQAMSTLGVLVFGVVTAIVLEVPLRMLRSYVTGWLGARFEHRVSVAGLKHLTKIPTRKFAEEETGVYTEQLRAAAQVRDYYAGHVLLVLFDLPFAFIYLAVIYLIGGWLSFVAIIMISVFLFGTSFYGNKLRNQVEARTYQDDRRYNFLKETFQGIHSVKTMAMERLMHRRYECLQEANVNQGAVVAEGGSSVSGLGAFFNQIMTIAIVTGGAYLVIQGEMTPGALTACIMLANRALQPLRRSLAMWVRYQSFKVGLERLIKLFSQEISPTVEPQPGFGEIEGEVELRDIKVDFSSPTGPLFENLNLKVKVGECVAILGDSGSGKSSLMNLISGILDPDSGEIIIDGIPIVQVPVNELDQRVAHLPQRGNLIAGTIMENITMFDDELTEEAIEASKAVALDKVVAGMRLGYETHVGDGAVDSMPAGIRQRIAIAREIVFDPRIILFDEANIAMDGEGDSALIKYLESKKGKATIILVAHRPSVVRMADRVFSLHGGQLHETSLDEHMDKDRAKADAETVAIATEQPTRREWELTDSIDHFPVTSDISLCLPALLASLKWRGASRTVAESLPHLSESMDLSAFRSIMATIGYNSRSYRCKFKNLDPRLLPCLFVPENSSAKVVLDWSKEKGFRVFNGETVSVEYERDLDETGEAFIFRYVGKDEKEAVQSQDGWTRQVVLRFKGFLFLAFAITAISTVLTLTVPLFIMAIFSFVLPTGDLRIGALLLVGVGLALAIDWKLRSLKNRIMAFMAGRSEYIIGNSIFSKILDLPSASIEKVPVAEQVSRVKDLESLREFFMGPLATLAYELPASLIFVVVLTIINPWMLVVVLCVAVAYALLGAITFRPQARRTVKATRLLSKRDEFLEETLDNMSTLKSADATDKWIERFTEISGTAAMAEFRSTQFKERVSAISQMIYTLAGVAALAVAGIAVMNAEASAGAIVASMIIMFRLTAPIQDAFTSASTIIRVIGALNQIDSLMKLKVEDDVESSNAMRPSRKGALDLSRVSFRYSMNADPALLGVSFETKPGDIVAIAGPNGSGKSSLLKLLVRAYHPQAGSIKLDGIDIRQLSPTRLREEISYMPQHSEVFYGTIAQNLRLVHPTATEDDLHWAADQAGVLDEILALEQGSGNWKRTGFEYRLSDSQANQMPNGFRQKLGLARALLKPATLTLFDEPGNGLDPDGDRAFVKALDKLRENSTIFIVSHRPSHLRLADTIIYLEHGSIRVMGSFENDNVKNVVMAGLG